MFLWIFCFAVSIWTTVHVFCCCCPDYGWCCGYQINAALNDEPVEIPSVKAMSSDQLYFALEEVRSLLLCPSPCQCLLCVCSSEHGCSVVRKVTDSSPHRSNRRIFFSRVNFQCWLSFWLPFHPHVTTASCKRPQSFCQKCRWQVTVNAHAPYVCGLEWSDTVKWCMVVWCTQNVHRDGSSFTWL